MLLKTAQHKTGLDCEAGSPISAQLGLMWAAGGRKGEKTLGNCFIEEASRIHCVSLMNRSSYTSELYKSKKLKMYLSTSIENRKHTGSRKRPFI